MGFKEINPKELHALIQARPSDLYIVDVREREEIEDGMIATAKWVPLAELPGRLHELPLEQKVVFVCRCGNRSRDACLLLHEHGHTGVYNLSGGIIEWVLSELPCIEPFVEDISLA